MKHLQGYGLVIQGVNPCRETKGLFLTKVSEDLKNNETIVTVGKDRQFTSLVAERVDAKSKNAHTPCSILSIKEVHAKFESLPRD